MDELAIIIPAYKPDYLEETLLSFVAQTNKNFKIYVGDDASPYNIETIVKKYANDLNIIYRKFPDNIGSLSLVKQWERCIELSSEQWIWLFSDDDIASENCVQEFFSSINEKSKLYKFNVKVIDDLGNRIMKNYDKKNLFQSNISSEQYINKRINASGFMSFAVEYIFHRDIYKKHKFIDFPLAWASDDATWFLYSLENNKNITGINSNVYWRYSGKNISSSVKNLVYNKKKLEASKQYIKWLKDKAIENNIHITDFKYLKWFSLQIASIESNISYEKFIKLIKELGLMVKNNRIFYCYMIISYCHFKSIIKDLLLNKDKE